MNIPRNSIVIVSILIEGFLVLLFCLWAYLTNYTFNPFPQSYDITRGVIATIPLLLFNFLLFSVLNPKYTICRPFIDLRDKVVRPLANELNYFTALIIAICAGVGEELFFRGLVQIEVGFLIANLLFAVLHFGTVLRKYALVALVYFFIGLYFSFLRSAYFGDLTGYPASLWVPIVAHALYDYIVIIYMKYFYKPKR